MIRFYFLLFISYSVIGWIMETILKTIEYKKFVNRGFLIGPYCPIYGCGALLMTFLLQGYVHDPIVLFVFNIIICSILEYSTSYIMEKIFKARWWDYSYTKYNINGRICLDTMIPFGLLGLLMMYVINPFIYTVYCYFDMYHTNFLNIFLIILLIIFLIDAMISIITLLSIRKDNKLVEKDNTIEMSRKVIDKIKNKGFLYNRLLLAFPNFAHVGIELSKRAKRKIDKYNKKIEKIRNKYR